MFMTMHLHHKKPHDNLYKKSGQWGYSQVLYKSVRIYQNMKYYWISDTQYVASGVNCLYSSILCSWQCICTTQKPHDHLYKNSGQSGIAKFCSRYMRIYETNVVLPDQRHQIRCQWSKLFIFFSFIFMGMHWHPTEAPWPFI